MSLQILLWPLHAACALGFAGFVAILAGTNSFRGRTGLVSLGAIALMIWSALWAAFYARSQAPTHALDGLLGTGWFLVIAALLIAATARARMSLLRAAVVGVFALPIAVWLSAGEVRSAAAWLGASSTGAALAALWLLVETTFLVTPFHGVEVRRFAACAATVLVLHLAATTGWISDTLFLELLLLARGLAILAAGVLLFLLCARTEILNVRVLISRQLLTSALITGIGFVGVIVPALVIYALAEGRGRMVSLAVSIALAVIVGIALLLAFGRKHARWVRVQVSKHFYRFRYDYREEWLRLTNTLVSESDGLSLPKRAIKGLADIVGSEAGALFISEPGSRTYVAAASWKMDGLLSLEEYEADELIALMERAAWIVDSIEYKGAASTASRTFLDDILSRTTRELLVVPLLVQSKLFGFVVLERPATLTRLSFEDIDLLRTGGRGVAGLLGQYYLAQRLTEAKQFEEFGRMTAFLLHDLTNISAQQSLLLKNAERHKGNAQFIDDALRTISGSVDRINRLSELVRSGLLRRAPAPVDIAAVIKDAVRLCAAYAPRPVVLLPESPLVVLTEGDRMSHGLAHLIRNSQQAASANGEVTVALRDDSGHAVITVADNGTGMSADFVRERLFRPFDSTKEGASLGIGAVQIRDIVKSSGGTLGVQTTEGKGSVFTIRIPLAVAAGLLRSEVR